MSQYILPKFVHKKVLQSCILKHFSLSLFVHVSIFLTSASREPRDRFSDCPPTFSVISRERTLPNPFTPIDRSIPEASDVEFDGEARTVVLQTPWRRRARVSAFRSSTGTRR